MAADRVGRRLHGGRVLPAHRHPDPRLHLDRPGPDAAHGRDGQRVLRLVVVRRHHRPGRDDAVRQRRAAGGVPPPLGRLPERRQADRQAQLPGAQRRGPGEDPAEGVQAGPRGTPRAGAHRRSVRPLDPDRRRRDARAGGALAAPSMAHGGLARGGCARSRRPDERAPAADPRRRRRAAVGGERAARGARRAPQHPRLQHLHGQGRAVGPPPAAPRDRGLLGRVPGHRGGPQRGRDPRLRRPLQRHPLLVLGAGLHVQHPAHAADPRRPRPVRDRPQLPDRAGHRRRRARGPAPDDRAGPEARPEARALALERPGRELQGRVGELHHAVHRVRRGADRPAPADRRHAPRSRPTTR